MLDGQQVGMNQSVPEQTDKQCRCGPAPGSFCLWSDCGGRLFWDLDQTSFQRKTWKTKTASLKQYQVLLCAPAAERDFNIKTPFSLQNSDGSVKAIIISEGVMAVTCCLVGFHPPDSEADLKVFFRVKHVGGRIPKGKVSRRQAKQTNVDRQNPWRKVTRSGIMTELWQVSSETDRFKGALTTLFPCLYTDGFSRDWARWNVNWCWFFGRRDEIKVHL